MERNDQTDDEKVGPAGAYPMPRHIPGQPSGGASAGANLGQARGAGQVPQDQTPKGISSQSGLNAYAGGQRKTLPSVPAPGQPGSRYSPVVVSREERAARRYGQATPVTPAAKKSLDIGMPPGMISGVPPEIMNAAGPDQGGGVEEPGVAEAAAQGFAGGFVAGAQQGPQNGRTSITIDPASERQRLGIKRSVLERDQLGSHTTAPGPARELKQAQLTEDLAQAEESMEVFGRGKTDQPAPSPAQQSATPGVAQPLIVEALDTVQGEGSAQPADSAQSRGKVVMNPKHLAVLAELDNQPDNAFDRSGGRYDR